MAGGALGGKIGVFPEEGLTIEGLHKIVAIKASMNRGLSEKLQNAFSDVKSVERPLVLDKKVQDPY